MYCTVCVMDKQDLFPPIPLSAEGEAGCSRACKSCWRRIWHRPGLDTVDVADWNLWRKKISIMWHHTLIEKWRKWIVVVVVFSSTVCNYYFHFIIAIHSCQHILSLIIVTVTIISHHLSTSLLCIIIIIVIHYCHHPSWNKQG